MNLFSPLTLPNGTVVSNRLAKAAMEENMADANHAPSEALLALYQAWADGGAGLIVTGNVMVDRRAMTGPGGVVLEDDCHLELFRRWARIGKSAGAQIWMQINHPGRQMQAALGQQTWAPSPVALDMGRYSNLFAVPKEMTAANIAEVIARFVRAAELAEQAGFDGVEIHAAHGYLLSQFLSPLANRRTDEWGGSLENRARLLLEVVRKVRAVVSPRFVVAVKLNSADFQRGGFSPEDAERVVGMLNQMPVDVVELSGGSYEAPAMQGQTADDHTLAREAYFLEFARKIAGVARMPLMLTGGIRRRSVAEQVIDSGIAIAGIATALTINPALPQAWRTGKDVVPTLRAVTWKSKPLRSLASMAMVKHQLRRLSRGRSPDPAVSPVLALLRQQIMTSRQTRQYRRWMAAYSPRTEMTRKASVGEDGALSGA